MNRMLTQLDEIYKAIDKEGFSGATLELLDNFINDVLYGRTNLARFNTAEHGGLCTGEKALIGAYAVCDYARKSISASTDARGGASTPANWEIDEAQEYKTYKTYRAYKTYKTYKKTKLLNN